MLFWNTQNIPFNPSTDLQTYLCRLQKVELTKEQSSFVGIDSKNVYNSDTSNCTCYKFVHTFFIRNFKAKNNTVFLL